jgi:hypothetical protein
MLPGMAEQAPSVWCNVHLTPEQADRLRAGLGEARLILSDAVSYTHLTLPTKA